METTRRIELVFGTETSSTYLGLCYIGKFGHLQKLQTSPRDFVPESGKSIASSMIEFKLNKSWPFTTSRSTVTL